MSIIVFVIPVAVGLILFLPGFTDSFSIDKNGTLHLTHKRSFFHFLAILLISIILTFFASSGSGNESPDFDLIYFSFFMISSSYLIFFSRQFIILKYNRTLRIIVLLDVILSVLILSAAALNQVNYASTDFEFFYVFFLTVAAILRLTFAAIYLNTIKVLDNTSVY